MSEGWEPTTLGDLLVLEYGKALPEKSRSGQGHEVLGSNGVVGLHSEPLVSGPGIVVGRKGTAGSVTWVEGDFWPIDTTYWVHIKNEHLLLEYARHLLDFCDLPGLCAQTGVPGLNRDRAYAVEVQLPPLAVQRRIVDLMAHLDNHLTNLRAERESAALALAAGCRVLTDPDNFDVAAPITDVSDILNKFRRPINESERVVRSGDVPYFGANGQVGWIDEAIFDEPLVLMAEDGGPIADWTWRPQAYAVDGPAWVNNHAHVLRARTIPRDWLYYSLRHRNLTALAPGGTRSKLTQASLRRLRVGVSNDVETRVDVLRRLEDVVDALERESGALLGVRKAAAKVLLTGRVAIPSSFDALLDSVA